MDKRLTILVADDSSQARLMVSRFITKLGHATLLARSGEEAVALFAASAPDLVLLDVHMPGMDGYETVRRIRELAGTQWVPIIFLSAATEDNDKIKGLEVGGDDYLTKPIHFRMLEAKMKVMQRIAEMQRLLRDHAEQLARSRDESEREQRLAKYLMDQIVRPDAFEGAGVEHWLAPAQHFSGDLLAAAQTPGGVLHVILADGTGHGLAAALSVLPVTDVFYSMTERGFTVASIARELNRKIKKLLPTGRFVAATLAAINRKERTIELWNGGNPTAHFVRHDGRILRSWPSAHPALGIFGTEEFSDRTESFRWVEPGQLYMCSDGLIEAENAAGEAFGEEWMRRVLAGSARESRFGHLRTALSAYLDGQAAHDDVSLIAVDCPRSGRRKAAPAEAAGGITQQGPLSSPFLPWKRWRLGLRLSAAELQTVDVLPFLMEWVNQVQVEAKQRNEIFRVLVELFTNALDHGVLGLESAVKTDSMNGFEQYLAERAVRLNALEGGFIEIEIEPVRRPKSEFLQLRVKDSGKGFDYDAMLKTDIAGSTKPCGRGIALLRALCAKVTYLGNGNEVIAQYRLS